MAKGAPSMLALLGLLAFAGYQNRDKISDMLKDAQADGQPDADGKPAPSGGGLLSELGGLFGGAAAGGTLSEGLGQLADRFQNSGQKETMDSWVSSGGNHDVDEPSLEQTLGDDTLNDLSQQTGLSRQEILARLTKSLPQAVDRFTPQGRLPDAREASHWS